MSPLFVIIKSFWMEFAEHKTSSVFLSIKEDTEVIVNSIDDYVEEY